jgi:predicted  nucleic acid-binding Zn-ribbon protein
MLELFQSLGAATKSLILFVASYLTRDFAPGIVVIMLLVLLVLSIVIFLYITISRLKAVNWLHDIIRSYDTPKSFTENIVAIDQAVKERWGQWIYDDLARGWFEYRETLVIYGEGENQHLKNSVRPATFINPEDLQFTPGFWKIVPGLFVTIGLFLTFLGLVAALDAMDVANADPQALKISLDTLLDTASAKFIMSLTGLFCSIVFTVTLRLGIGRIETSLHKLCSHTEYLLKFISLEDVAVDQLSAIKEQREHFRTIGMELVAELGRPLREELPKTIANSISEAMAPMMEKVTQVGTEGVGGMVQDLSSQFTANVSSALANASDSIEMAGRKIGDLAARMDQSSGNLSDQLTLSIKSLAETMNDIKEISQQSAQATGDAMSQGAEKLLAVMSETLEDIKINTGAGAKAISDAATEMRAAAETFKEELSKASLSGAKNVEAEMVKAGASASGSISEAGKAILNTFGDTATQIANSSQNMADQLAGGIIEPLAEIQKNLENLNSNISESTAEFRKLADGVRSGAEASVKAAKTLTGASNDLAASTVPIRTTVESISGSIAKLETTTTKTSETLLHGANVIVQSSEKALTSAVSILQGEQKALEAALYGVQQIVQRMQGQGDKLDDLDDKLGAAFEKYAEHVTDALGIMSNHSRKLSEEISPALDVLREVVDQAEKFIPENRTRRP